jgi:hypothetical protein
MQLKLLKFKMGTPCHIETFNFNHIQGGNKNVYLKMCYNSKQVMKWLQM